MLAILRAREKRLRKESVVCKTRPPVVLAAAQQGGEAVEESCTRPAAPTDVSASFYLGGDAVEESCTRSAAPTDVSAPLQQRGEAVEESCAGPAAPTVVSASPQLGGGAVEESCVKPAAPTDVSASKKGGEVVEESGDIVAAPTTGPAAQSGAGLKQVSGGTASARFEECKDEQCLLNVSDIVHQAQTKKLSVIRIVRATSQASAVRVKPQATSVRASHQTLVKRFATASGDGCGSSEWDRAAKARLLNLQNSLADSSGKKYEYWFNRFSIFCQENGRQIMPFCSVTVSVFLSHLAESADGLGGADAARAALGYYFSLSHPEQPNPTNSAEVKLVLRGLKRRFSIPVCKKAALSSDDFYKVIAAATDNAKFLKVPLCKLRLAAQVSIMYCTMSRFEESAELKCSQISKDKGDLVVTFRKGKTYQFGEARQSVVAGQPGLLNPVKVISAYTDRLKSVSKVADCLLFPALRSSARGDAVLDRPASYESVLKQFKAVVVEAGVTADPSSYGLHSMRRGAVTSAVNNGATDHAVMKQMRVSTNDTVRRYASLDKASLKSASTAVFKKL